MSKNEIKKIRLTSPVWEFQRIVDICNEQSKKGFQLNKIRVFGKSTFIKNKEKRYIYAIDFNQVILKRKNKRDEYIELFEEQGWEFVDNTFNGFSIFRKEYKEEIPEEEYQIYTDKESEKELYVRISKIIKTALTMFFVSLMLITIGFIILIASAEESEAIQMLKIAGLCVSVVVICYSPIIIFFKKGLQKIKKEC